MRVLSGWESIEYVLLCRQCTDQSEERLKNLGVMDADEYRYVHSSSGKKEVRKFPITTGVVKGF